MQHHAPGGRWEGGPRGEIGLGVGGVLAAALLATCTPRDTLPRRTRHPDEGKHDLEYSATHELRLTVETDPKRVRLSHRARVELVPLGQWMLHRAWYSVGVPWHTSLARLSASRNGHRVPAAHIVEVVPKLPNVFLHSSRLRRVFSPPVRLGEPLQYDSTRVVRDVRYAAPLRVPNLDYVKRFEVRVAHPSSVKVTLHWWSRLGEAAPAVIRTSRGDEATTRVVLENLTKRPPRPWDPLDDTHALIWFTFSDASGPLHPASLPQFTRWMRGLYDQAQHLSATSIDQVRRLIAGARTPSARARALYDFVRTRVRYIADERGESAIRPRTAEMVFRRRWGDCKDKANLLMAMAKHADLTVLPVLVAAEETPVLPGVRHLGMYNHAIVAVQLGDQRVFADPTASHVPFGLLPLGDEGRRALVLDPAAPVSLRLRSGRQPPTLSGVITLSPQDPRSGRATLLLRGPLRYHVEAWRRRPSRVAWTTKLASLLSAALPELRFQDVRPGPRQGQGLSVVATVDTSRFVVAAGKRLFVRRTPRAPCPRRLQARRQDQAPLLLPSAVSLELTIQLPALGIRLEAPRQVRRGAPELAWFESSAQRKGQTIVFRLRQGRERRYLTGPPRSDYLRFCQQVQPASGGWWVLRRGW